MSVDDKVVTHYMFGTALLRWSSGCDIRVTSNIVVGWSINGIVSLLSTFKHVKDSFVIFFSGTGRPVNKGH